MFQQLLALIIIAAILSRLFWQKKKQQVSANEFVFWLGFWVLAAVLIVSLRAIDRLVASIGFSGSGIEVLLYLAVATLFYLIFRLRLRLQKIEQDITKIVKNVAIDEAKNNEQRTTNKK